MNAPMTKAEVIAASDVAALTRTLRAELAKGKDNVPANLRSSRAGWYGK